jgi:hypothetical protein
MAESGFITFARVARRIVQAVLPAYRSKCSKHRFPQPQLLAMFRWMHDEDWTVREAAVHVAEYRELRAALGLHRAPDDTTLYRFLRRLDEAVLAQLSGSAGRCGVRSSAIISIYAMSCRPTA